MVEWVKNQLFEGLDMRFVGGLFLCAKPGQMGRLGGLYARA
jgi:hypothetical protein